MKFCPLHDNAILFFFHHAEVLLWIRLIRRNYCMCGSSNPSNFADIRGSEIGDIPAEIALNILSFLISLSYATIIKTRCPPASPEGEADGGQAPGVLHHVMGEE